LFDVTFDQAPRIEEEKLLVYKAHVWTTKGVLFVRRQLQKGRRRTFPSKEGQRGFLVVRPARTATII